MIPADDLPRVDEPAADASGACVSAPPSARRGRPPSITRDDVARAVLEVGFRDLTFAAVYDRLGVSENTLFRHVPNRDELVRLGLELALGDVDWPSLEGPWREVLESYALAAWHGLAAHPGAATESSRGIVPRAILLLMDELCTVLLHQGFTVPNAVLACDLVFDLVTDHRRGVENIDALLQGPGPGRNAMHTLWEDAAVTTPGRAINGCGASDAGDAEERSLIHEEIQKSIAADPLYWFRDKLHVVLDGVEHALAPRAPS
jgi:AcrR family transcriptional regulator